MAIINKKQNNTLNKLYNIMSHHVTAKIGFFAIPLYCISYAEQFDVKNPFTNTTIGYFIFLAAYFLIFKDQIFDTEYKKKQRKQEEAEASANRAESMRIQESPFRNGDVFDMLGFFCIISRLFYR
jgi:hypothetical protein